MSIKNYILKITEFSVFLVWMVRDIVYLPVSLEFVIEVGKAKEENESLENFLRKVVENYKRRKEYLKDKLCDAIMEKRQLRFRYDFQENSRIVEPHILGVDYNGNIKLGAYQIEGYSKSGVPEGWKIFFLDKIECLEVLDKTFEVREDYNPSGYNFVRDICEVEMLK